MCSRDEPGQSGPPGLTMAAAGKRNGQRSENPDDSSRIYSQRTLQAWRQIRFRIPGGPSIPYIEALRNQGIEFILTANEASAGIMADVTGRITGIPGICHATFGPAR